MKLKLQCCPKCERDTLQVKIKVPKWRGKYSSSCFEMDALYCTACGVKLVVPKPECELEALSDYY